MAFHVFSQILNISTLHLLIELLLILAGVERNPGPARKLKCGSCKKLLGKSTKKRPLFYCTICGWVHYQCSGLQNVNDYNSRTFTCTKCRNERVISSAITHSRGLQTAQKFYTNSNYPSAYGSVNRLIKETGLKRKTVETYLKTNSTYTKFKQTRHRFPRLKVQSYRLNEIWSLDLADMQSLSADNKNTRYLLVAVDTLSRFLRVQPMKNKYATTTRRAFATMTTKIRPEKVWTDDGKEFLGSFKQFCEQKKIILYQTRNEKKSAFAERNIRSIKSLIYKYLNENHTSSYIDNLQNVVNVINSRVNRVTGLAPKKVTKQHTSFLVSLTLNEKIQKPKFSVGETVRIKRNIKTFHRGYQIQFSHEIFRIDKVLTLNPPTYRVVSHETSEAIDGRFYEAELTKYSEI